MDEIVVLTISNDLRWFTIIHWNQQNSKCGKSKEFYRKGVAKHEPNVDHSPSTKQGQALLLFTAAGNLSFDFISRHHFLLSAFTSWGCCGSLSAFLVVEVRKQECWSIELNTSAITTEWILTNDDYTYNYHGLYQHFDQPFSWLELPIQQGALQQAKTFSKPVFSAICAALVDQQRPYNLPNVPVTCFSFLQGRAKTY